MFLIPDRLCVFGPDSEPFFFLENLHFCCVPVKAGFPFLLFFVVDSVTFILISNMASQCWPCTVMAIKLNKCGHTEAKSLMLLVRNRNLVEEIFNNHHDIVDHEWYEKCYTMQAFCKTEMNSPDKFEVENFLTVREVMNKFHITYIVFNSEQIEKAPLDSTLEMAAETATKKTVDAF